MGSSKYENIYKKESSYTCLRFVRFDIIPDKTPDKPWLGAPLHTKKINHFDKTVKKFQSLTTNTIIYNSTIYTHIITTTSQTKGGCFRDLI